MESFHINMQALEARLATFRPSSKRSSSQTGRKKGAAALTWPHKALLPQDFAEAGFFFNPSSKSPDNVTCFFCGTSLAEWEDSDIPVVEHIQHRGDCKWAQCRYAAVAARQASATGQHDLDFDPMSTNAKTARRATFEVGRAWPHEKKKGWKCKISKMVDAGWCFDPDVEDGSEEDLDGVTCFYCNRSVSGWEPKDDPVAVHQQKEGASCLFFVLVQKSKSAGGKRAKAGVRGVRDSNASKVSRMSVQSAISTFSEQPSLADSSLDLMANNDDSIMTDATLTGTGPATKKSRGKATSKGNQGRSRAGTVDAQLPLYPDISKALGQAGSSITQPEQEVAMPAPARTTRKGNPRQSRQADSSVMEISAADFSPPAKRPKRTRNGQTEASSSQMNQSVTSTQLQAELEQSISIDLEARFEREDRTPEPASQPAMGTRGTKRTSDGASKHQSARREEPDSSVLTVEFPVPPTAKTAPKVKKGRKASKQQPPPTTTIESQAEPGPQVIGYQDDLVAPGPEAEALVPAKKNAPAKKASKGRKASSTRSSRLSKASAVVAEPTRPETHEDLDNAEREIEAELARIEAEEAAVESNRAMEMDTNKAEEFEPSPTSRSNKKAKHSSEVNKHVDATQQLERELEAEIADLPDPGKNMAIYVEAVARPSPKDQQHALKATTPSPNGSDKENMHSSALQTKAHPLPSPTKAIRVPLAPGTPTRAPLSPNKQLSRLVSQNPWSAIDIDDVLLAFADDTVAATPRTLAARFAQVAGTIPSPEKALTVEQWVQAQAAKGEVELQRRCEELVTRFEREGNRALGSLEGIVVAGR